MKKSLSNAAASLSRDAAIDLRPVMAGRRGEKPHAVVHRAALRIGRAVVEPPDARERNRGRAHGAGLERHVEIAVGQPLGAERGGGLPDRQHLGMRGRIAVAQGAVAGARDHGAVAHDHAADRHLVGGLRRRRLGERVIHERLWHKTLWRRIRHEGERIAKVIARAGLASRREAEAWIAAGRVAVNGAKITSPALNVSPADKIVVDGKPLPGAERTRLFLYHKPRGLVTTSSDPQGPPDHLRRAAEAPAAADQHRAARPVDRGAAAADQ